VRNAEETLEELDLLLEELQELAQECDILVEGRKDRNALTLLGVRGEFLQVQDAGGIFGVAEGLSHRNRGAIILTDWDRKGGQLAEMLRNALKACEVPYDDTIRTRLSRLSKKEIKDIESLPSYISFLVAQKGEGR